MANRTRSARSEQRRSLWQWITSSEVIDDCQGELTVILDHHRSLHTKLSAH